MKQKIESEYMGVEADTRCAIALKEAAKILGLDEDALPVIKVDADPPVCSDEDCNSKHQRNERSRKQLSILMYIFPAIAIVLVVLNVTQGGRA